MPVVNGDGKFLEIRYKAKYPAFPNNFKGGETFSHVFGINTSPLETLII